MILKPLNYYRKDIKNKHSKYSKIWKYGYSPSNVIGHCTELFKKHKPYNHQDFLNKYLIYGRNPSQIENIAQRYLNEIKDNNVTLEECIDIIILHAVIETFDGCIVENKLKETLLQNGWWVKDVEKHSDDTKLGIDMIATNQEDVIVFQVKPDTFIKTKYPTKADLINDRIICYEKEFNALSKYTLINKYKYLFYDSLHYQNTNEILFLYYNNKCFFNVCEIINKNDGSSIINYKDFQKFNKISLVF